MRLSHTRAVAAVSVDEPDLVSAAGLVPVLRLASEAGVDELAGCRLTVPTDTVATDEGANAGGKVTVLVAGMLAGAGFH